MEREPLGGRVICDAGNPNSEVIRVYYAITAAGLDIRQANGGARLVLTDSSGGAPSLFPCW